MTSLTLAGLTLTPGFGPSDAYTVEVEDRGTRCEHRTSDAAARMSVDCPAPHIPAGEAYVLVRHGFRLGMPTRLECLLAAGVLTAPVTR